MNDRHDLQDDELQFALSLPGIDLDTWLRAWAQEAPPPPPPRPTVVIRPGRACEPSGIVRIIA